MGIQAIKPTNQISSKVKAAINGVTKEQLRLITENASKSGKTVEQFIKEKQIKSKFPTYELTEDELRGLAAVCFSEQGCRRGAMMEASLMANRYEKINEIEGNVVIDGTELYKLVSIPAGKEGHWFAYVEKYIDSGHLAPYTVEKGQQPGPVTDEMMEAVRLVLEDKYRVLPKDINEHDEWNSECHAYNGDTQVSREECIPFETIIKNKYGAKYIFFGWADPNVSGSDPFGLAVTYCTDDEIQKKIEILKKEPYFSYDEMEEFFNEEINNRVKSK